MKELRKRWRKPIMIACIGIISCSIAFSSHTAHYPHLVAAGAFLVLAFLSGELCRLLLGLSLCLFNIILAFVSVNRFTEFGIYLIALAIGIAITAIDNRRDQNKLTGPSQPAT